MSAPALSLPRSLSLPFWLAPLALGYCFSYLLRNANAVAAPRLIAELGISDANLGLITGAYFLSFGAMQLPAGLALDRFGPRRTLPFLVLLAALGAFAFAQVDSLWGLALSRAAIGAGVAACLMGSFKAFALWRAPEENARLTGWVMSAGAAGSLAGSWPLEMLMHSLGWRGAFIVLALGLLPCAWFYWRALPDSEYAPAATAGGATPSANGLAQIFRSGAYWHLAPLAALALGGFMAIHALWIARWLMSVNHLTSTQSASVLAAISAAMLLGFILLALLPPWLQRRGIPLAALFHGAMALTLLALLALLLAGRHFLLWPWPLMGLCFSFANLAYGFLARRFPAAIAGRANTALNLAVFIGAFSLQWGIGAALQALQRAGWKIDTAFTAVFAAFTLALLAAWLWSLPLWWRTRRTKRDHDGIDPSLPVLMESVEAALALFVPSTANNANAANHGAPQRRLANRRYEQWFGALGAGAAPSEIDALLLTQAQRVPAGQAARFSWPNEARHLQLRCTPFMGALGPSLLLSVSDISEQEAARRYEAERSERASRLIEAGEIASSIAHELNQPLGAIRNYCAGLIARLKTGPVAREEGLVALEKVVQQTERASAIISRIRALLKKNQPKPLLVSAPAILHRAAEQCANDLRQRHITLKQYYAEDLPPLFADALLIEQALVNLLRNAAQTIERRRQVTGGGIIELRAVRCIRGAAQAVEISVSDNGGGMEPELLEHCFDAFHTSQSGGLGIGLNLCRAIVEAHQGSIEVRNLYNNFQEEGQQDGQSSGCRFALWIPAAPESATIAPPDSE